MSTPRFLVTAGNTRERIDAVRDWGNIFTGGTGFSIARALATVGEVDLLTSNRAHLPEAAALALPYSIHPSLFGSHAELRGALSSLMARSAYHAVFMTAAVSDYKPERVYEIVARRPNFAEGEAAETWIVRDIQAEKVKSIHRQIAVVGVQTEKLVDLFRGPWRHQGLLVKFKLEVEISRESLLTIGEHSRLASGADYLVANTLDMVSGPDAGAFLLSATGNEWVPRAGLATRLVDLVKPKASSA